jgi:hypothetical protein
MRTPRNPGTTSPSGFGLERSSYGEGDEPADEDDDLIDDDDDERDDEMGEGDRVNRKAAGATRRLSRRRPSGVRPDGANGGGLRLPGWPFAAAPAIGWRRAA